MELASRFVPAADEVYHLQNGTDAECRLFQKIAEQGHYGGTPAGESRQGTYAAAPSGILLASTNDNDAGEMANMMRRALAKWESLSRAERLLPKDPTSQSPMLQRFEQYFPENGLVLRVNSRDLPRANQATDWRGKAWNQDYAWFTPEEVRQFVPRSARPGEQVEVPLEIIRRIARCHLVDNVRGQTEEYEEKHVERARLTAKVLAAEGNLVNLRLQGETRTSAAGVWPVGMHDANKPGPQKRGFEATLVGGAILDRQKQRFTAFEMVALGTRWGGTQYNGREDDLAAGPMGIVFTLAGRTPAERVAPAFFYAYGWEK